MIQIYCTLDLIKCIRECFYLTKIKLIIMEQIDVNEFIKREMKKNKVTNTELATGLKIHPSSIYGILSRPTIQVQRLGELSEFFKHNFFREIADNLPGFAPEIPAEQYQNEIAGLQSRIRDLELEVNILRQTIRDLAGSK